MAARVKLLRVYIDTSVVGGCLDEDFRNASTRLIERSRTGDVLLVMSDTTLAELADAQHIAVATIAKVDVLVSWNFKHIVNLERIRGFNAVNLLLGYPMLEIRSPPEVWRGDDEDI